MCNAVVFTQSALACAPQLPRNGVAGSAEMECRLVSHRSSRHRDCSLVHEYSFFIGGPKRGYHYLSCAFGFSPSMSKREVL
jgi:hypothetical protein